VERLWSRAAATGHKEDTITGDAAKHARTVAVEFDQSRTGVHGKEAVDGFGRRKMTFCRNRNPPQERQAGPRMSQSRRSQYCNGSAGLQDISARANGLHSI